MHASMRGQPRTTGATAVRPSAVPINLAHQKFSHGKVQMENARRWAIEAGSRFRGVIDAAQRFAGRSGGSMSLVPCGSP